VLSRHPTGTSNQRGINIVDSYRKIIEVSIKLMSEKGYKGTSLRMIADKVGLKTASIFHHFKEKELIANDGSLSGCEKLKEFFKMHMGYVARQGDVLKVYLSEFRYLSKRNRKKYLEGRRHYTNMVEQIVKEACEENPDRFKGLDPLIVAHGVFGMCNWAVFWYRRNGRMSLDEMSDQLFQMTIFSCSLTKSGSTINTYP